MGLHARVRTTIIGLLASVAMSTTVHAAEVKVAVAANFTEPAKEIAALFEKATGHKVVLSFGATGKFYAQISHGAPFDVLLAADNETPTKAVAEGHAVKGTQFTYAVGRLVLYSTTPGLVTGEQTLKGGMFDKIAIANPATAPYGAAAVEVLEKLGVKAALAPKIVQGQNIGQTYQFIQTSNAEIGFVALSQVATVEGGSRWVVPGELHKPILQDAVLLDVGKGNSAARAFIDFLKGKEGRGIIGKFGYAVSE